MYWLDECNSNRDQYLNAGPRTSPSRTRWSLGSRAKVSFFVCEDYRNQHREYWLILLFWHTVELTMVGDIHPPLHPSLSRKNTRFLWQNWRNKKVPLSSFGFQVNDLSMHLIDIFNEKKKKKKERPLVNHSILELLIQRQNSLSEE